MITRVLFFALAVFVTASTQAGAKEPKPLFASETVLQIKITGPFKEIIRNAPKSTDPYGAVLTLAGEVPEEHAITLSARGNSRRDRNVCDFPPLRVEFNDKPEDASLFNGQGSLKLVTHCKSSSKYQQYYLLEYLAYKLLNVMTPASLNVRLAQIEYVEQGNGKNVATRYGFLIEDTDDAAKRLDLKEIDVKDITVQQLNPDAAALYAMFQYMIGNLDWSMYNSVAGEDCCHNSKLIGEDTLPLNNLIPVPYDFDYSGLVDAPYAIPPDGVRVRSVRNRRYRGFCMHNTEARAAADAFNQKKEAFYQELADVPGLDSGKYDSTKRYLDDFFQNIGDEEKLESRLLKYCRD